MIVLPWISRAMSAAGFDTGWSAIGEEIVNWINPEPQPTIEELEQILQREEQ